MRWIAILGVFAYRWFLRPVFRRRCLFEESCSAFAIRALRTHGLQHGVPHVMERLASCRMPMSACFVVGADGAVQLLSAQSEGDRPIPPRALELLAFEASMRPFGHLDDSRG
ncbi:MAG: membrane protein insertion efficiency factor YidD [Kofleriaceae bacterium]